MKINNNKVKATRTGILSGFFAGFIGDLDKKNCKKL